MKLNLATLPTVNYLPDASYVLRCGWPGWFQRDVSAVWDYIRQARRDTICLELQPQPNSNPEGVPHLEWIGEATDEGSTLVLRTSGTTGAPKEVRKSLAEAFRKHITASEGQKWLLTYAPFRWAGVSVMLYAFACNADLIVPKSLDIFDIFDAARIENATHISLTPSLFRKLVLAVGKDVLSALDFVQITFGGEAVTQSVLDLAHSIWPHARLSHVYAATEFGDICSVSDGLAGVPREKFERLGFELLPDGELVIDGRRTGDLWELKNNRYYFVARREEVINVGGVKVSPLDVEAVVLNISGVVEARAYAVASPLVGQMVGLDYSGSAEVAEVKKHIRERLPKVAWPVSINKVECIEITDAGKLSRSVTKR